MPILTVSQKPRHLDAKNICLYDYPILAPVTYSLQLVTRILKNLARSGQSTNQALRFLPGTSQVTAHHLSFLEYRFRTLKFTHRSQDFTSSHP
jgi:hypothetical protein